MNGGIYALPYLSLGEINNEGDQNQLGQMTTATGQYYTLKNINLNFNKEQKKNKKTTKKWIPKR